MILTGQQIRELCGSEKPIITGFIDFEKQLQMHGFDLTVEEISEFAGQGVVDFTNAERKIPETKKIAPDENEFWNLKQGVYKVTTNENFNMPLDTGGFAQTRSTLLRMGASVSTGLWDAGFSGKCEFLLNVINPEGIKIKKNAKIAQLCFFKLSGSVKTGYNGAYKNLK